MLTHLRFKSNMDLSNNISLKNIDGETYILVTCKINLDQTNKNKTKEEKSKKKFNRSKKKKNRSIVRNN